ncbi:uncharacterized protein LOC117307021 [Asterias rubens]|uniref:uncharacterized protein LOC117307021 n=1 Tax=Asterias rubens TaxID=7604 RepID=UPI001455CA80|nr:uncharacterized protein LOC117307021 [Asterias rubens]
MLGRKRWAVVIAVCSILFWLSIGINRKWHIREDATKTTKPISLFRSEIGTNQANWAPNQPDPAVRNWTSNQPDPAVTNGHSVTLTIHLAAIPVILNQLYCIAIRSAALFWSPKLGRIGLIMDAESQRDHEFAARLKAQEELLGFTFEMMYQPLPPSGFSYFTSMGHFPGKSASYNRQLWNSFFMDEYVTTSIVAWTDGDVMFTSPVNPESILNGDKIRTFAEPAFFHRKPAESTAFIALGKKSVAQFTCFPLYLWRDTITNCRNHILKHMKVKEFEEAFVKFRGYQSFPVNILFSYAFYFEHDRYDWHIRLPPTMSLQQYNRKFVSPGFGFNITDLTPEVCNTMHKPDFDPERIITHLQGYCTSMHYIGKRPEQCEQFRGKTDFQVFEPRRYEKRTIAQWCEGAIKNRAACAAVSDAYYKNVAKHVQFGLFNFDLNKVKNVEKAAMEMNITCRKFE